MTIFHKSFEPIGTHDLINVSVTCFSQFRVYMLSVFLSYIQGYKIVI